MHLREFVKQRWADAGLYSHRSARLKSFLKHVDDHPLQCWDDYGALIRQDYDDLFDLLIPRLLSSDDKLLRVTLLRQLDLSRAKELAAARQFLAQADPVADRPEINALLARDWPALREDFRARPGLVPAEPVHLVRKPTNIPVPKAARKSRAPRKRK